jgi:glucosylceramidase
MTFGTSWIRFQQEKIKNKERVNSSFSIKTTALIMPVAQLVFCIFILTASTAFAQKVARIYSSTADLSQRMVHQKPLLFKETKASEQLLEIDTTRQFQSWIGFGGTYSEATAYNLKRLSVAKRKEVLDAFFNTNKSNWNLLRITINSCDASSEYYSYAETPDDTLLTRFSIQKDIDNYMIPGLREALKRQAQLKLFASPWTPPVWMKDSKVFNKGKLTPQYYSTWALYFAKYLSAYQQNGIKIWGITPQNEPEAYEQRWDACGWQPEEMRDFMSNHLIPTLHKTGWKNTKILLWDHNKNNMMKWCDVLLSDKKIRDNAFAIAHHWYDGGEAKMFEPLSDAQKKYPQYPLMAVEQGVFGLYLEQPEPAELYARDIMGNLQNGSAAWVVWGMAFDHKGGPNHAQNFNHSPIMVDWQNDKIFYNASYYYISHFSRFIKPLARRVHIDNPNASVQSVAFKNKNGEIVVVLLNTSDKDESIHLKLKNHRQSLKIDVLKHAIVSVIFKGK